MSAILTSVAEDDTRPRSDISLWNLQENLARLADELAEAARKYDAAASIDTVATPSLEAMSPREYFVSLLDLRRMRERYFGSELFGEPAWDIMLDLMIARIDGREIRGSNIKPHGDAPDIVTKHYIQALAEAQLIDIFVNPDDVDDPSLSLSSEAARRMAELYRFRTRG